MASKHIRPLTSLLLLVSQPVPAVPSHLQEAYGSSLSAALSDVARLARGQPDTSILEVALSCSPFPDHADVSREQLFERIQRLLAGVYRLVCQICSNESIETEGSGGVDTRVFLLADEGVDSHDDRPTTRALQGPVIDLVTLASCRRPWQNIYVSESEEGESLLRQFLHLSSTVHTSERPSYGIQRVPKGTMTISQGGQDTELHGTLETGSRHFNVAVGGTFDHLHVGHKLLLTMTAFLLEPSHASNSHQRRLIVGITGDELLKNKKYIEYLGSWNDRQEAAADFISTITDFRYSSQTKPTTESRSVELLPGQRAIQTQVFADLRVEYVELTDPFGPTVTDESISALIISAETRSGGEAVNTKRQEAGWKALEVFEVDVLDAGGASAKDECFQDKISSTEIRRLKAEKANA